MITVTISISKDRSRAHATMWETLIVIRKIPGGFFVDSTATPDGVLRRTGCRKLFAGEKKERKRIWKDRERERHRGRGERENEGVKREKDCQKPLKDFTMKITYMYSSVDIYPLTVCTAREER
jgi:hypothetical protein